MLELGRPIKLCVESHFCISEVHRNIAEQYMQKYNWVLKDITGGGKGYEFTVPAGTLGILYSFPKHKFERYLVSIPNPVTNKLYAGARVQLSYRHFDCCTVTPQELDSMIPIVRKFLVKISKDNLESTAKIAEMTARYRLKK